MRKISLEDFRLTKIKADKKINVVFSDGTENYNVTSSDVPHPDLNKALIAFNKYFAYRIGLTDGINNVIKDNPDLESKFDKAIQTELKRVSVYGAAWCGKDEHEGIKLIGHLDCPVSGFSMTIPVIVFESDDLGFEEEVYELSENLKEEVYKFLFENKKAQINLLDAIEESEQDEDGDITFDPIEQSQE